MQNKSPVCRLSSSVEADAVINQATLALNATRLREGGASQEARRQGFVVISVAMPLARVTREHPVERRITLLSQLPEKPLAAWTVGKVSAR